MINVGEVGFFILVLRIYFIKIYILVIRVMFSWGELEKIL